MKKLVGDSNALPLAANRNWLPLQGGARPALFEAGAGRARSATN